jgi:hypothetical protein
LTSKKGSDGMNTIGAVVSVELGEIRLGHLCKQTDLETGDSLLVTALDRAGMPAEVVLSFTSKWSANGFETQLACPRCCRPCRVLRDGAHGFVCGRCCPPITRRHRRKNTNEWASLGGREVDEVIRLARSPRAHGLPGVGAALAAVIRARAADAILDADALLALPYVLEAENAAP